MLEGTRIIEIEGLGPCPFAGMMLADLGAEVIVVHRKGGGAAPGQGEATGLLDRGKRSIALDLKDAEDVALLKRLVVRSDALIEGFRPGVMERLGLGPEALLAERPALVYGRMTGWGQDGPRAQEAGHDMNYIGLSGALWYGSAPGDAPMVPATLVGDIGGGALYLVAGVLSGLLRALRTGQGAVVDAAIVDGSAHMMALLMSLRAMGGMREARGQSLLDGPHWSRTYECADGAFFSVQALEPQFYAQFLAKMGLAEDAEFKRQYDAALWSALTQRLAALFAAEPQAHWTALFAGSDACAAPVHGPEMAARDPHMAVRGVWTKAQGVLQPAAAPRFDGVAPSEPPAPPARDADRAAILADLEIWEQ